MSSVGGLFEDQRLIHDLSEPNPIRPYGYLKLSQETMLYQCNKTIKSYVYRLSSVYGFIRLNQRRGLISTLIENSFLGRTTVISGSMNTNRDFVWAPDVSRYVVEQIESGKPTTKPIILASGKNETIYNVKQIIETSIKRRIYCRYQHVPWNDAHINVSANILPNNWTPSYVTTNIRRVLSDFRGIAPKTRSTKSGEFIQ